MWPRDWPLPLQVYDVAERNGDNWAQRWWPYAVIALLGGTGGAGIKDVVSPPRPDPYYGEEAKALEARIMKEHTRLEARMERLSSRQMIIIDKVANLPPEDLIKQVVVLEEAVKDLERHIRAKRYPE